MVRRSHKSHGFLLWCAVVRVWVNTLLGCHKQLEIESWTQKHF